MSPVCCTAVTYSSSVPQISFSIANYLFPLKQEGMAWAGIFLQTVNSYRVLLVILAPSLSMKAFAHSSHLLTTTFQQFDIGEPIHLGQSGERLLDLHVLITGQYDQ